MTTGLTEQAEALSSPPPAPVAPLPAGLGTCVAILSVVAALALWAVVYALGLSNIQEGRTQHTRYDTLRESLAAETTPIGGQIKEGTPVALMSSTALGLNRAVVVEGTSSRDLQGGPGLSMTSVLPGQSGVSVIFGKSVTFGAPFRDLTKLKTGNLISVTTQQGSFSYHVIDVRVAGDPYPAPVSGTQGRLILVGAMGHGWRSGWAPSQIVYVDADLAGAGKSPPGGGPTVAPTNQLAMARDTSGLTNLVLLLELLLVVAVGFVWARRSWGGVQVWLVGTPALVAVVWLVTESASRLLPNLL